MLDSILSIFGIGKRVAVENIGETPAVAANDHLERMEEDAPVSAVKQGSLVAAETNNGADMDIVQDTPLEPDALYGSGTIVSRGKADASPATKMNTNETRVVAEPQKPSKDSRIVIKEIPVATKQESASQTAVARDGQQRIPPPSSPSVSATNTSISTPSETSSIDDCVSTSVPLQERKAASTMDEKNISSSTAENRASALVDDMKGSARNNPITPFAGLALPAAETTAAAEAASAPSPPVPTKCYKCHKRRPEGCSKSACFACCDDLRCVPHKRTRDQALLKTQILQGTTPIQLRAAEIRSRRIPDKRRFVKEPGFLYTGDTIMIWNVREFLSNSKWKDDAIRKCLRRMERSKVGKKLTAQKRLGNSRRRFRRFIQRRLEENMAKEPSVA
ncbi:hypothetical protein MPSEU_000288800 [Mayamaea pseudoterrestris]|nr:hypothetical protein MPSEU_000288800 [Mayamaea pseudoterrestris]